MLTKWTNAAAQAQHGSAPDIAGQDRANPTSLIVTAAMLLAWLGTRHGVPRLEQAGTAIDAALDAAIADPATRTPDLGGALGTAAFAKVVAGHLAASA
jgi:isocitrate/isopropylmalate dehydrogenase